MDSVLVIGDFARATHLSVKTLRHYHRVGLLEPAVVDPDTGYRYYTVEQIPTAQVIRRFRALEMPLDEIASVISAPDLESRDRLISGHLQRLQNELSETQAAVASLTDLLHSSQSARPDIHHRTVPATMAAAISETIDIADATAWWQGALGELRATLRARGLPTTSAGGVYASELFSRDRGAATLFIPIQQSIDEVGRVTQLTIPAAELATTIHLGPPSDLDRAYGALATYVTRHALGVDGPVREYYLIGPIETDDESRWQTEVGWPIFITHREEDGADH
ncbi:MAG TPA: MerR family transcriptional regulator [Galbitalea sp.]|nr:MerR family transcriptional regulator [Galbitalea sp.]